MTLRIDATSEATKMSDLDDRRRRTTLSDVAARAGVSAVTVSRALRKPGMVSADLRRRVESAVHDLSYVPNQLASALASARTGTIGVVVPSFTNGVFGDYLRGLHDILVPAGFQVLILNS
ncbi:MAG: LacI family DNA-binding transcriptional regulator, partial [Bauldia sp.]